MQILQKTFPTTGIDKLTITTESKLYNLVTTGKYINAKDAIDNLYLNADSIMSYSISLLI